MSLCLLKHNYTTSQQITQLKGTKGALLSTPNALDLKYYKQLYKKVYKLNLQKTITPYIYKKNCPKT